MYSNDHFFLMLLALAVVVVGVGTGVFVDTRPTGTVPGPLVGRVAEDVTRGPKVRYAELAERTRASLAEEARIRLREAFAKRIIPEELGEWLGVLLVDVRSEPMTARKLLANDGETAKEEGPPFHFFVDEDGLVTHTVRWTRQRPWRVAGLEPETEWIVIYVAAADPAQGEGGLLLEILGRAPFTKGARARQDGRGGKIRMERRPE